MWHLINQLVQPLQVALGVSHYLLTGSRHVVVQLNILGFSLSYNGVKLYEMFAVKNRIQNWWALNHKLISSNLLLTMLTTKSILLMKQEPIVAWAKLVQQPLALRAAK